MEKLQGKDAGLGRKWENFWYYYKWYVIAGAFVLLIAVFFTVQSLTKKEPDALLYYAGECYFGEEQAAALENAVAETMKSDPNGDGKKQVQLVATVLLSGEKQATAVHLARDEQDDGSYIYAGNPADNQKEFHEQMAYGEAVICLLSEPFFEEAKKEGRLAAFSDTVGTAPAGAIDDYGIRLKDTAAGQYYEILKALPDDTVLCCKKPIVIHKKAEYRKQTDILRDFLAFSIG